MKKIGVVGYGPALSSVVSSMALGMDKGEVIIVVDGKPKTVGKPAITPDFIVTDIEGLTTSWKRRSDRHLGRVKISDADLAAEFREIKMKRSSLSRAQRDAVVRLFLQRFTLLTTGIDPVK